MLPALAAIAQTCAIGDRFLDGLVGDFTAADWAVRDGAGHDPRWLVGHLAVLRGRMAFMLGLPALEAPWESSFSRGTTPADVPPGLDIREVLAAFHATHAAMAGAWESVTEEALARPLGRTLPDGSSTVAGGLGFLAWHEAYHLGQLGLLRRLAGKPGVA